MKSLLGRWLGWGVRHRAGLAIVAVMAVAVFFRLWQLHSLPPGLHPDEAANGLDIFRIQEGDWRVLYNTNGPREALFFYLQTIFVWLFGNTVLALRLAPALIGVAAVGVTYLWTREWWNRRTALVAALFMATGSWAVTMSRNGFRASMMPLMIALTAWLATLAYRRRRWYWYVLTGISLGAGFYTYISFKFAPLVILILMIFSLWRHRRALTGFLKPLLAIFATTAIILVPMGIYGVSHPEEVLVGRSSVGFNNPELNHGHPLQTLAKTVGQTALMFNIKGDPNYRHNLGGAPMLNFFVGTMFVLGLLISLRRWKDLRYFTLITIFGTMLLPEMLTAEGIPHGLRAIGVLPVVYMMAAIGVYELLSRWRAVFPTNPVPQTLAMATILALLAFGSLYDFRHYFVAWANAPQTYEAYSEDAVAIADYLISSPGDLTNYVVIDGYSVITIEYLTRGKTNWRRVEAVDIDKLALDGAVRLIVAEARATEAEEDLQSLTQGTTVEVVKSAKRPAKIMFRVYEVKHGD